MPFIRNLPNVTLIGIDCLNVRRLVDVADICQSRIKFGDVRLLSSIQLDSPYVINIEPLTSIEECSEFIIKRLYKFVRTEFMLIIEPDGFILNPDAWDDDFLTYDYVGAPWAKADMNVGNGGFSLRSTRLMELVAKDERIVDFHPEDSIICRRYRHFLEEANMKFAPETLARKFSFEANYKFGLSWNGQFGFHSYSSNLAQWRPLNYINPFRNLRFLLNFQKSVRARNRRRISSEVILSISGVYKAVSEPLHDLVVKPSGSRLKLSNSKLKNETFYPFDEVTYFSDKANALVKLSKDDAKKSIILNIFYFETQSSPKYSKCLMDKEFDKIIDLYRNTYPEKKHPFSETLN